MEEKENLKQVVVDPLKLRRLRGSVSRAHIGRQIGVGASQVANYENGERTPPGDKLLRLMILYNAKPEDLITT